MLSSPPVQASTSSPDYSKQSMPEEREGRRAGRVIRRGVERLTEDRALLERIPPPEFLESDPWRVLRIQAEFVEGFDALAAVGPAGFLFRPPPPPPPPP